MKKTLLCLFLLTQFGYGFAQGIKYQKSYAEALAVAAKTNKPIFLLIAPQINHVLNNANYRSGLDLKVVTDLYNKNFVNFAAPFTDSSGIKFRNLYHISRFPTYLFLDPKGVIVYRSAGNSNVAQKYIDMADTTLSRIAAGKTIGYYESLDKSGAITALQLKEYITLKEDLDLFDNAKLIDEYANFLTLKTFEDYNEVLFILKAGPYAYGKVFNLCVSNKKITDSIFKHEPEEVRKAINNRIIANTRNEAIKTKNMQMATGVANFARTSWGNNYREAGRAYSSELLAYYRAIKDTTRYFPLASNYYDTYYLNITADSAKKLQQKLLDNIKSSIKIDERYIVRKKTDTSKKITATIRMVPAAASLQVAGILNSAAYEFYTMGTHSTNYLLKALIWSRRSIELLPNASYYDTLAHIMYRLNFYDDAVLNENKAVEMAVDQPVEEQQHLMAELGKMKMHTL